MKPLISSSRSGHPLPFSLSHLPSSSPFVALLLPSSYAYMLRHVHRHTCILPVIVFVPDLSSITRLDGVLY